MYEELVKRLRDRGGAFDYEGWTETAADYEKVADAIEQLSLYAETMRRLKAEGWFLNRYFTMPDGAGGRAMAIPEPPKEEA